MLDGEELTTVEKFKLQGMYFFGLYSFPTHLSKYAESMKMIQNARKEKHQQKEESSVLTQGIINEEEALRELKFRLNDKSHCRFGIGCYDRRRFC